MDATDFAPILARMIAEEIALIETFHYTLEDLQGLDELNESAKELPPEEVQELARAVHHLRLAGKKADDPLVRLEMSRLYQRSRARVGTDAKTARLAAAQALQERADTEKELYGVRQQNAVLIRQGIARDVRDRAEVLRKQARRSLRHSIFRRLGVSTVLVLAAWWATLYALDDASKSDTVALGIALLTLIPAGAEFVLRPLKEYRAVKVAAESQARLEVERERRANAGPTTTGSDNQLEFLK